MTPFDSKYACMDVCGVVLLFDCVGIAYHCSARASQSILSSAACVSGGMVPSLFLGLFFSLS